MELYQTNYNRNHLELNIQNSVVLQKQLQILSMDCDSLHLATEALFNNNPAIDHFSFSSFISLEMFHNVLSVQHRNHTEQVPLELITNKYQTLTQDIFASLSEDGFLQAEDKVDLFKKWGVTLSSCLEVIQSQTGLGFENRLQFFRWQLLKMPGRDHVVNFIDECFHELLNADMGKILKKLGISSFELHDKYLSVLRGLKMAPRSASFSPQRKFKIDAQIGYSCDHFDLEVTQVCPSYLLTNALDSHDIEVKRFYTNHLEEIKIHIEGIKKREKTLKKVIEALIPLQRDYLSGISLFPKHIHPKDLAEQTALNPSTLARCLQNKTILCVHGLIPLKLLATPEVCSDNKMGVLKKLQELIKKEDKKAPYSDQKLLDLLKAKGAKISRRTLTKYRHSLKIPDARRRFFN